LAPRNGIVGIGWFDAIELQALTMTPADAAHRDAIGFILLGGKVE
jgi:hypothetical protein